MKGWGLNPVLGDPQAYISSSSFLGNECVMGVARMSALGSLGLFHLQQSHPVACQSWKTQPPSASVSPNVQHEIKGAQRWSTIWLQGHHYWGGGGGWSLGLARWGTPCLLPPSKKSVIEGKPQSQSFGNEKIRGRNQLRPEILGVMWEEL